MTRARGWLAAAATFCLVQAAATPAPAAAILDEQSVKLMGGTYAADCAKSTSPRVIVDGNGFVVVDGARKTVPASVEIAASWFGNNPPDDYRTTLLSRVKDDPDLLFIIYEDAQGYFGMLDNNETARVRPELTTLKFRQCKAAPAKESAPAGVPAGPEANAALRADKNFRSAYAKAMGPAMRERWIAVLDGPAPPSRTVSLEGVDYVTLASCKAGDCSANNLVVVWSAKTKKLYGLLRLAGENGFVGAPPVPVAEALSKLWQEEWGDGAGSTP